MSTSTLFYHSTIGYVNVIPRPTLTAIVGVDGKAKSIKVGTGRFTTDIMFFAPARKTEYIFVTLADGAIAKFSWSDMEYFEQGRHHVDLDAVDIVTALPDEDALEYEYSEY